MNRTGHGLAQRTLVRMMFDPTFAAGFRDAPETTVPNLPAPLAAQLATTDPRALRTDPQLRLRTLRQVSDELKVSTLLYITRHRSYAALMDFFSSSHFHGAIEQDAPLFLALAHFFTDALTATEQSLALDILRIETALAEARRAQGATATPAPTSGRSLDIPLWRAKGVTPLRVAATALPFMHTAEKYLFELSLMPALSLCPDAPQLLLEHATDESTEGARREERHLVAIPLERSVSLVDIDASSYWLLALASGLPRASLTARATAQLTALGLETSVLPTALDELITSELLVTTAVA